MSYAPSVEGYEATVEKRANYFKSGSFVPVGDPEKAAKVMVDLVDHPEPPIHLILGSEAASLLQQADATRKVEFEKWLPVTVSTDHDESANFFETDLGKLFAKHK